MTEGIIVLVHHSMMLCGIMQYSMIQCGTIDTILSEILQFTYHIHTKIHIYIYIYIHIRHRRIYGHRLTQNPHIDADHI